MSEGSIAEATESFKAAYEQEVLRRKKAERSTRLWRLFGATVLGPALVVIALLLIALRGVVIDISDTADAIRGATSSEAQRENNARLGALVVTLNNTDDCNTRKVAAEAIDVLERRGVLSPGGPNVTPCPSPPTTTTTVP